MSGRFCHNRKVEGAHRPNLLSFIEGARVLLFSAERKKGEALVQDLFYFA